MKYPATIQRIAITLGDGAPCSRLVFSSSTAELVVCHG